MEARTPLSSQQFCRWNSGRNVWETDSNPLAAQSPRDIDLMGRFSLPMVNNIFFAFLFGSLLGFLSGLGVGGGSLLILWLTLVLNVSHETARIINLLFFIPSAIIATFFRWKQGAIDLKKFIPAVAGGLISAGIFSVISRQLDMSIVRKLFGILLLLTGIRELFYRPRKAK